MGNFNNIIVLKINCNLLYSIVNYLFTATINNYYLLRKLKEARKDVAAAREEKDILSTEQQQLLREKTKLELAIKDLTDDVDGDNKSKVTSLQIIITIIYLLRGRS